MSIKINLHLIAIAVFLILAGQVFAQEIFQEEPTIYDKPAIFVWRETVSGLRQSTDQLLEKNTELNAENTLLTQEIVEIKRAIDEAEKENRRLLGESPRFKKLIKENEARNKEIQKEINLLEGQWKILKKQRVPLQKKLDNIEAKLNPREKEALELRSEKGLLESDMQSIAAENEVGVKDVKSDISRIKDQISAVQREIEKLKVEVDQNAAFYPQLIKEAKELTRQNKDLYSQIGREKKSLSIVLKEQEVLKNKNAHEQAAIAKRLAEKNLERRVWQARVDRLESQIEDIEESTPSSEVFIGEEQNLLDEIDKMRTENQDLKRQLEDLDEAVAMLKREMAMSESLLDVQKNLRNRGIVVETEEPPTRKKAKPEIKNVAEGMAYAYATQGLYQKAVDQYKKALKEGGNRKNIYFNLAYIYYKVGDLRRAIHYYKKVLGADPDDIEARQNLRLLREELKSSR